MSYLALYRKYRPANFDEVIGQDDVVQILKNQILSDRIGHAYLLTGIRGTGKTSIAKIFARAVNCSENTDGNPCNQCEICKSIEHAGVMDIIEIDAASNRGVDEIREIKDKVIYPPKIGRYKVYIIDEVHMLTKEAFNALLKTLEEPPSHIMFILATTEPNKLPATILSRCQRFDIHPISQEKIAEQIHFILQDNHIEMDDEAIRLIASRGDHSMRDALSILDQAIDIRKGEECITCEAVTHFLGMAEQESLMRLAKAVLNNDAEEVILLLDCMKQKGMDAFQLTGQLIDLFRKFVIVKTAGGKSNQILETAPVEIEQYKAIIEDIPVEKIFSVIDGLIEDRQKMRYNDLTDVILEMALLKQCRNSQKKAVQASHENRNEGKKLDELVKEKGPVIKMQGKKFSEHQDIISTHDSGTEKKSIISEKTDVYKEPVKCSGKDIIISEEEAVNSPNNICGISEKKSLTNPAGVNEEDEGKLATVRQVIEEWNSKQDFFTSQVVAYGNLRYNGQDHYIMRFHSPEHNMYAEMFNGRIQQQIQEIISKVVGKEIILSSECSSKNYEEMDIAERTAAILGSEYQDKIKITDA